MSAAPTKSMADKAGEYGLSAAEYGVILQRLNREPNDVELGVFSVMWSEHCSYKSSKRHLSKFPTTGPRVICGPGENAGVVDIGDGQACIFKMESHNHPSFIEPYQGAATGVGGIMRDVFTMGARPVALLNALRFGDPSHPKTKRLVAGVVSGIGGYGNCVGGPTVARETNFHRGYDGNILGNAMCLGLADADKIFYSAAPPARPPVVYYRSKTRPDGLPPAPRPQHPTGDPSGARTSAPAMPAPRPSPPPRTPTVLTRPLSPADGPAPTDYAGAVLKLMSAPDRASKRWLWEQSDRHVMAD